MGRVLFGFLIGFLVLPVAVSVWVLRGHMPVAVADPPIPQEREIAGMMLDCAHPTRDGEELADRRR
jgi:hypothetical protein